MLLILAHNLTNGRLYIIMENWGLSSGVAEGTPSPATSLCQRNTQEYLLLGSARTGSVFFP